MGFALSVIEKIPDRRRFFNPVLAVFLTFPVSYLTAPSGVTSIALCFFIAVAVYSSSEVPSLKFCASYAAFFTLFMFTVYLYSNGVRLDDYFEFDWISIHLVFVMAFHSYFAPRYVYVGFNWLYVLSTFSWSFIAQLASFLMMLYIYGDWRDLHYMFVFLIYGFVFAFFGALMTVSAQCVAGWLQREMQQGTKFSEIFSIAGAVFMLPYGVIVIMALEQSIGQSKWSGFVFCTEGVFCLKDRMLSAFSSTVTLTFGDFSPDNSTAKVFAIFYAWWGYVWALIGLSRIIKAISGNGR